MHRLMAFGRSALIPLALATAIFVAGTASVAVRGAEDAAPAVAVAAATPAPTVTPPPPPPATPTSTPHLSKTEYVQRAEAICAEMNQQEAEMDWEFLDEAARDIRRMLDVSHEAFDRLRALPPPPEDAAFLEDHLFVPVRALLDLITPHMERMAVAFEEGNLREMQAVVHEMETAAIPPILLEDHETPLRDYGFDECVLEDDQMGPPGGSLQA